MHRRDGVPVVVLRPAVLPALPRSLRHHGVFRAGRRGARVRAGSRPPTTAPGRAGRRRIACALGGVTRSARGTVVALAVDVRQSGKGWGVAKRKVGVGSTITF
mmetsp:Transcript_77791/g.209653  ORF Transcript_77791/g.209653 Transcript_77791/m.209653 type:complete len:103 (+) Transcript_77791:813-1121(+)